MNRSTNIKQQPQGSGGYLMRQKRTAELYEAFELIYSINTIFQEVLHTDYCNDVIGLAEEMGFNDIFSREEITCILAEFMSNRIPLSRMETRVSVDLRGGLTAVYTQIAGYGFQRGEVHRLQEASQLFRRYLRLYEIQDLQRAIKLTEEVLAGVSADNPHRASVLNNLGCLLCCRYRHLKCFDDLENAIKQLNEAIAGGHKGSPSWGAVLRNMSFLLCVRDQYYGIYGNLDYAIELAEEAVTSDPTPDSYSSDHLVLLATRLTCRFEQQGNPADLDKAIKRYREAIYASPAMCPSLEILNSLGGSLSVRYNLLGNIEDLEESIKFAETVVEVLPLDSSAIINLSNCLYGRYTRLGTYEDLDRAIKQGQKVLDTTLTNEAHRPQILSYHSVFLMARYNKLGILQDLQRAIQLSAEAVELTPQGYPERSRLLDTLSCLLFDRYQRLGNPQDLKEMIKRSQEAVALTPPESPYRPGVLSHLADYLHTHYMKSKSLEDLENLEKAIEMCKQAVAATSTGNLLRPLRLHSLGRYLSSRYILLGNSEDIEEAIERSKEAVATIPADHPDRGQLIGGLTILLSRRFISVIEAEMELGAAEQGLTVDEFSPEFISTLLYKSPDKHLLAKDICYLCTINVYSWSSTTSQPSVRANAARVASFCLYVLGSILNANPNLKISMDLGSGPIQMDRITCIQVASSLLDGVVKLFPQISPRYLERDDQQAKLLHCYNLAATAAAMGSLAEKGPAHCLKLLELGRGNIQSLSIDCRSDLSELREERPDLAGRFNRLRNEIDSPMKGSDELSYERNHDRRVQAAREIDETLASIRNIPKFVGFQLPPSPEYLIMMAREGPIITINCSYFYSEALIVSSTGIKALPLSSLKYSNAIEQMTEFSKNIQGKRSTYVERNKTIGCFLVWLWSTVVEPVFKELQFHPVSDGETLPRVWWIGTGPLTTAPFHAAGDHSPKSTNNTLCRAISSYTPTIKALSYAREGKLELLHEQGSKVLMVTVPQTPNYKYLNANEEASKISSAICRAKNLVEIKSLCSPSVDEVLDQLGSCQAVHFACHGVADPNNPSDSHLLLVKDDGSGFGTVDKLTVGHISSRNMKGSRTQIAYLSACSTAVNRERFLADESIHIANGFQLAGFSHVLATMWNSEDSACQNVAVEFYRLLFDGVGDNGHSKVSSSFHYAVKRLRERLWKQPILWASFIHTGA